MPSTKRKKKTNTDEVKQADYKTVFNTDTGRRVLHDILKKGFVYDAIEAVGEAGQRAEGARKLALHIAGFVAFDKKSFVEVIQEAEEEL